jgi:hypothetical protein
MIRRLFKKSTPIKLGRWGVTYEPSVLDKRIHWANHHHCGSEVCENKFIEHLNTKESKQKTIQQNEKLKKNKSKPNGDNIYKLDPLVPYCM